MNKRDLIFFKDKTILVVGGSGYIGSRIIDELKNTRCKIIRFDKEKSSLRRKIELNQAKIINRQGDITDPQPWKKINLKKVDIIFFLAAQTDLYVAEGNPLLNLEINVLPIIRLLEYCKKIKNKPIIIFAGTVTEFGLTPKHPINENYPDNPVTIYDLNKLIIEKYLKKYSRDGFIKSAILRLSNIYGPGPRSSASNRGILNQMIEKAVSGQNLFLYGNGIYLRDYLYISDVANAFLRAASKVNKINGLHLITINGKSITIAEAANLIAWKVSKKTDQKIKVEKIPPPKQLLPIEFRNFKGDNSLIRKKINWKPLINIETGIDLTIDYFLKAEKEQL